LLELTTAARSLALNVPAVGDGKLAPLSFLMPG
jgi:hypothetical protein